MKVIITTIFIGLGALFGQEETPQASKIYWNSLSTDVNVGVLLADDGSLEEGRIQIRVSFDGGESYADLGDPAEITGGDVDDLKEVFIPKDVFEAMDGFNEGATAQFIAEIWDKGGNSMVGDVSASILTIAQPVPPIVSLELVSSNPLEPGLAMPGDSITFQLVASETIDAPIFEINGDEYGGIGVEKTWKVVYSADEADDGPITFNVDFKDLAQNAGATASATTDNSSITYDGTPPELENVKLSTSNANHPILAINGDTVFLDFTSTEPIRDLDVLLNANTGILKSQVEQTYSYYHIFTEQDTERVTPIAVNFKDMAGNLGEKVDETSDDGEVTYDMTPPQAFRVETVGSAREEAPSKPKEKGKPGKNQSDESSSLFSGIGFIIAASVTGVILILLNLSWWMIFSKAGEAGWKVLVPFFNLFVLTKVLNKPVWWIVIYLLPLVGYILISIQVSQLFSKKILYAVGLIFIPFVFYPMLGLGKSQISGAQPAPKPAPAKKK